MTAVERPDVFTLRQLRQMGLTDQEIGYFYDLPGAVVTGLFRQLGPLPQPLRWQSPTVFWTATGTVLALIRSGHVTLEAMRLGLGVSTRSEVARFVAVLVERGWVRKTPGKAATLGLTAQGQTLGSLIVLAQVRPEGGLERYRGPRVRSRSTPSQRGPQC